MLVFSWPLHVQILNIDIVIDVVFEFFKEILCVRRRLVKDLSGIFSFKLNVIVGEDAFEMFFVKLPPVETLAIHESILQVEFFTGDFQGFPHFLFRDQ